MFTCTKKDATTLSLLKILPLLIKTRIDYYKYAFAYYMLKTIRYAEQIWYTTLSIIINTINTVNIIIKGTPIYILDLNRFKHN